MTTIKELDEAWGKHMKKYNSKKHSCEICGKKIIGRDMDMHYLLKHPFWLFCRKTGIHWQIHKLKRFLQGEKIE